MVGVANALCLLAVCGRALATPTALPTSSPDVDATNATRTCPTKLSEHRPFTKVFFDEACVAAMPPRSDGTCPIETVDGFAKYYFGALCLVATIVSFMSVLFNVSLLQLGGIPNPRARGERGKRGGLSVLGMAAWVIYMLLGVCQFVAQLLSMVMTVAAFAKVRDDYRPCLQPWAHDMDLLGVAALPTFAFTPVVQFPMMLMFVTWAALIEGVKVYCAARRITPVGALGSDALPIDGEMHTTYTLFCCIPLLLFNLLAWLLSGSFVFGIVFHSPIFLVVALAYVGIGKLLRVVATKVMASESERAAVTTLKGMLWWAVRDNSGLPGGLPNNPFGRTLLFSVTPLPFSPLVIYGALLAAHVYAGHTPAENMHLVDVTYEHAFQFFRTAKFSMPAIDLAAISFDPTVAFGYIAALGHIDSLDAAELLEGARVLNAFSYALSILKTLVSVCAGALAAGEQLGMLPNVQFSDCAHWAMMKKRNAQGNFTFGGDGEREHIAGLDALVDEGDDEKEAQRAAQEELLRKRRERRSARKQGNNANVEGDAAGDAGNNVEMANDPADCEEDDGVLRI